MALAKEGLAQGPVLPSGGLSEEYGTQIWTMVVDLALTLDAGKWR